MKTIFKSKADDLFHPILTGILEIKIAIVLLFLFTNIMNIVVGKETVYDYVYLGLMICSAYGAYLMLNIKRIGLYLIVISQILIGVLCLAIPEMGGGAWRKGFMQIAIIVFPMFLRWDGKNAFQVMQDRITKAKNIKNG